MNSTTSSNNDNSTKKCLNHKSDNLDFLLGENKRSNISTTNNNLNGEINDFSINLNVKMENPIFQYNEKKIKSIFDDNEMISDIQYFSDEFQVKLIKRFLKEINSKREIEIELMGKIMDILYNNPSFGKNLIDNILNEKKNPVIVFRNYHNMQHFANILNSISINLDNQENENYELNFAIIHIAERSFFYEEANMNKFYLSAMLSKNKIFNSKNYWIDLIEFKIFRKMDVNIKKIQNSKSKIISKILKYFLNYNFLQRLKNF